MRRRIVIGLSVFLTAANGASAAVLQWGCQGQLGDQQVIFNRESLVIVDTKVRMGDVRTLRMTKMELPPGSPPHADYEPVDFNGGFEDSITFTRVGDDKRKPRNRQSAFPTGTRSRRGHRRVSQGVQPEARR